MSFFSSSARRPGPRRRRVALRPARGFTLIELFVSQAIVGVMAAAIFALIAAQTKSFHTSWSTSEAQIRLRESTHLLLRDLQGIGSDQDLPGQLLGFTDGGTGGSDAVVVFRQDAAICTGALGIDSIDHSAETITLELVDHDANAGTANVCPMGNIVGCSAATVSGRVAHVRGDLRAGFFYVSSADETNCTLSVPTGDNADYITNYESQNDVTASSMTNILNPGQANGLGSPVGVLFGSSIAFSVDDAREVLQRSVNGLPPTDVIDDVRDLQIELAHDLDLDGVIDAGEWNTTGTLAGATPANFRAVRLGLMTFASSKDNIVARPPSVFGNRNHTTAPDGRRYRYSFVLAAARNR